jgi:23S rRNA (cytosine1962-C5)-methyltransferase
LEKALALRESLGLTRASFRWVMGEADQLPGLILDCYRVGLEVESAQVVLALQAHTAGADRWLPTLAEVLPNLVAKFAGRAPVSVVVRNDLSVRKLEGVPEEAPRWWGQAPQGIVPRETPIWVRSAQEGQKPLPFLCDWFSGQKTGFFLDQADNVALLVRQLARAPRSGRPLKVLDLCSYVGQWSGQLLAAARSWKLPMEATLLDASTDALELARLNCETASPGAQVKTVRGDVLSDLASLPAASYDVVISDPPGLVKSRKDLPAGTHAYLQVHTQAARLVRKGGWWLASSCSSLFTEEAFVQSLAKGAARSGAEVRWVAAGGQALDHPVSASFPEGRYLKAWLGVRSS